MKAAVLPLLLMLGSLTYIHAGRSAGAGYRILSDVVASGGATQSAPNGFSFTSTVGEIAGPPQSTPPPASPGYTLRSGFPQSLYLATSLTLTVDPTTFASTAGVTITATLDDGTQIVVSPQEVGWHVTGPVSGTATGLTSTHTSGGDMPSSARAEFLGRNSNIVPLLVLKPGGDGTGDGVSNPWQLRYGMGLPVAGRDTDHDGLDEILEAFFNLDPGKSSSAPFATSTTQSGGQRYMVFSFRFNTKHRPGVFTYLVERNPGLTPAGWTTTGLDAPVITSIDGETDLISVRSQTPMTAGAREFVRLKVTLTP